MRRFLCFWIGCVVTAGCAAAPSSQSGSDAGGDAGPIERPWGEDTEIVAFDSEHVYFGGGENRRSKRCAACWCFVSHSVVARCHLARSRGSLPTPSIAHATEPTPPRSHLTPT